MSMGLAIVGYGKMGRLIEQLAPEYGFDVRAKFDGRSNPRGQVLSDQTLQGVDVAVEFTSPEAAPENIRRLAAMGVNSVSGTTGWFGDLPAVREAVTKSGTGLVWAPNFSVGVNLFMQCGAFCEACGLRSVGLGDSPLREKRHAFGHAEKTCGGDASARLQPAGESGLESRRGTSRHT